MESLAQLEALCERLYNSQDSAERAHAENALKCFSVNTDYISQCQYILDNASTPYSLMLASSSLLKQVTDHSLSLQLRLDISNILIYYCFSLVCVCLFFNWFRGVLIFCVFVLWQGITWLTIWLREDRYHSLLMRLWFNFSAVLRSLDGLMMIDLEKWSRRLLISWVRLDVSCVVHFCVLFRAHVFHGS